MSRSVIVLGQHRSGTSAVAGILHHLGIPMGNPGNVTNATHYVDGWPAYTDSNPYGQFEDNDFVKLFMEGHGSWQLPIWWKVSSETVEQARVLVQYREAKHDLWGLKTPQLCYTLPYLLGHCEDPVVIITHRDFAGMVESLAKRDKIPLRVSEQIQSNYYILHDIAKLCVRKHGAPSLTLQFNDVMRRPAAITELIMELIGLPHDLNVLKQAADSIRCPIGEEKRPRFTPAPAQNVANAIQRAH